MKMLTVVRPRTKFFTLWFRHTWSTPGRSRIRHTMDCFRRRNCCSCNRPGSPGEWKGGEKGGGTEGGSTGSSGRTSACPLRLNANEGGGHLRVQSRIVNGSVGHGPAVANKIHTRVGLRLATGVSPAGQREEVEGRDPSGPVGGALALNWLVMLAEEMAPPQE